MISVVFSLVLGLFSGIPSKQIRPLRSFSIPVPEPSDICLSPSGFYIVSDDGLVFETDTSGNVLRKSDFGAFDLEAICSSPYGLWAMDERTRFASRLDPETLKPLRTVEIAYSGGRNKGFESLVWNPSRGSFLAITEKDPIWLFELDTAFRVINREKIQGPSDVSGLAWKEGRLFLLSDEDHAVFRMDARSFRVEARFDLGILNPEGLVFFQDRLMVVSDDRERLYQFPAKSFFE